MTLFEQYVLDIKDFSSQYGKNGSMCYVASNIAGPPAVYPEYGDASYAYSLRSYGTWWDDVPSRPPLVCAPPALRSPAVDFVDLRFDHAVVPFNVNIFETFNPGSVIRIWGSDTGRKWTLLWEGAPSDHINHSRIFSPTLKSTTKQISLIRMEFNQRGKDYYSSIDAVQLIGVIMDKEPTSLISLVKNLDLRLKDFSKDSILCTGNFLIGLDLEKALIGVSMFKKSDKLKPTSLGQKIIKYSQDSLNRKVEKSRTLKSRSQRKHLLLLPDELLFKIFQKLDLVSLCRVSATCSTLKKLIHDPLLYVHVNLKNYWWLTSDKTLGWLSSCCSSLQSLDLSWCANYGRTSSQGFMEFIYLCGHNLTSLYLNNCSFVDNYCLYIIGNTCPKIEVLSLNSCKSIDQLGFGELKKLSHLKWLNLSSTLIEIRSLEILLQHTPHLEHLLIDNCVLLSLDEVCVMLASFNRKLVSLVAWKTRGLTQRGVNALTYLTSLKELDIGWSVHSHISDGFNELAQATPHMERVSFSALRCLQGSNIGFALLWKNLRQIDLVGTNVRKEGVENLLKNCSKLKLIDVSYCDQISRLKIDHWKRVYPNIEIKGGLLTSVRVT